MSQASGAIPTQPQVPMMSQALGAISPPQVSMSQGAIAATPASPRNNWPQIPVPKSAGDPALTPEPPGFSSSTDLGPEVLQKLVAALASQGKVDGGPETVKPGVASLPKMPAPSGTSALTFSDWLHTIGPAMADISDSSEQLWLLLKQEVDAWYHSYLATDPLSRLSLRTDPSLTLMSPKWNRTRTRMESMVMDASPDEVKEEISAARIAGIFPVMCRLYVIFGPGSLQEREEGLVHLTNPRAARTPKEAVAELRSWRRWCNRFVSLGGTLPDPSILLKALSAITAKPLQDFPEVQFRISLTRASLQVDVLPTSAKVDQLHRHLLSEMEVISRLKPGEGCKVQMVDPMSSSSPPALPKPPKSNPPKAKPKAEAKAVATPKAGAVVEESTSPEDCRAFLRGGQGCKYGGKCHRPHNWMSIPKDKRANLCINCGGEGHRAEACTKPKRDKPGGVSSEPSSPKKPSHVPKPKGGLPDAQQMQGLVTGAAKLLEALGNPVKAAPPSRDTSLPVTAGAAQAQAVPIAGTPILSLSSLQEQLSALQNQLAHGSQPQAKAVAEVATLEGIPTQASDRALLDSGATHAVSATCNGPTFPCEVALAGDQVQMWSKNACGTLSPPATNGSRPQTLLPLGQLVGRLGCKVSWCRHKGLRLNHPKRGLLQTYLSDKGCPELPESLAQELISELETQQISELQGTVARTIGTIQSRNGTSSSQSLLKYVREGTVGSATAALLSCPGLHGFNHDQVLRLAQDVHSDDSTGWQLLKGLPYPRRFRKRLFKTRWLVNFGPKVSRSFSEALSQWGYCVLEASELVGRTEAVQVLLWACSSGRFAGSMCWGGSSSGSITEAQELWARWFWAVASVYHGTCLPFLVEGMTHQAPRTRELARWGQAWTIQLSESRVLATNLDLRHVDSRVLHDLQGTACLETEIQRALCGKGPSLPYLAAASALPAAVHSGPASGAEDGGSEEEGSMSAQPGDLDSFGREFLKDLEALIDQDVGDKDLPRDSPVDPEGPSLASLLEPDVPDPPEPPGDDTGALKLSSKERAMWRRHLESGHLPYRQDCLACTMGAGLGIQHRRVRFKDSFSMSWDITGPFREIGKTGKHSGFRYLFVAGVRVPTCLFRDVTSMAPEPGTHPGAAEAPTDRKPAGVLPSSPSPPLPSDLDDISLSLGDGGEAPGEGGAIEPNLLFSELESPAIEEEEGPTESPPHQEFPASRVASILDEGPSMTDEEVDRMVTSLKHPVEQVLLRFAVPLRNRQAKSILSAVQYVVTETNRLGLPIKSCHSDKEGQSEELQTWLRQNCIVPSNTQGADAKSNGLAERLVSWFKARMRHHLAAGKVPVEFWPYAAQFASQDHLDGLLERRPPQLTFGRKVLFRAKAMTNEAKKVFSTWEWGRYLGRSMISSEGHHILKDSTGAVITSRSIRAGLVDVDDELLEPLVAEDPEPIVLPVSPRRLREKTYVTKVSTQELMAEEQASKLLQSGRITPQAVSRVLQHLAQESTQDMKRRGCSHGHWYLGGYRRGHFAGLTKATEGLPQVLRVVNRLLLEKARAKGIPEFRWVSVGLFANPEVPVHKDIHNEGSNFGLVIPGITNLWTEESLNSSSSPAGGLAPDQASVQGYLTPLKPGLQFNPKKPHAVVRSPEWIVVGYTPNGFPTNVERERLLALGFQIHDAKCENPRVAVVVSSGATGAEVSCHQVPPEGATGAEVSCHQVPPEGATGAEVPCHQVPPEGATGAEVHCHQVPPEGATGAEVPCHQVPPEGATGAEVPCHQVPPEGATGAEVHSHQVLSTSDLGLTVLPTPAVVKTAKRGQGGDSEVPGSSANYQIPSLDPRFEPSICQTDQARVRFRHFRCSSAQWEAIAPLSVHRGKVPGLGSLWQEIIVDDLPRSADLGHPATLPVLLGLERDRDWSSFPGLSEVDTKGVTQELAWVHQVERFTCGLGGKVWAFRLRNNVAGQDCCILLWEYVGPPTTSASSADPHVHLPPPVLTPGSETVDDPTSGLPHLRLISSCTDDVIPAARACPARLPRLSMVRADPIPKPVFDSPSLQSVEPTVTENLEAHLAELEANQQPLEVTHTASPREARLHLERWKEAMQEELNGQLTSGCLIRRDGPEVRELLRRPGAEVLSSLNVWTVKPPKANSGKLYRRKVRTVACGNQSEVTSESNTYAAGARAEYVRLALSMAANRGWNAFSTDISQAFLLAPKPSQRTILLRPTREHVALGLASPTELWEVDRAVYGLRESPKWWSTYRDDCLRAAQWDEHRLESTSCDSLWIVKDESGDTCGVVVTYVDDFLILGSRAMASGFRQYLASEFGWTSSDLENYEHPGDRLRFLGMEIERISQGFRVHQKPYVEQLLSSYDVGHSMKTPLPRMQEEPTVVTSSPESVKQAQRILGELLWISQRSRPDISFAVSLLASWLHRNADEVVRLALRVLSYVASTKEDCLYFERQESPDEPPLICFTDASFSPYGDRSVSGIAIVIYGNLVSWRAAKQAFVVLSSSEAELVSATEGVVQGQSLQPLLRELGVPCERLTLRVDNTSAIHLLHGRGANRTRHLRVRSAYVSELIDDGTVVVEHLPGEDQLADAFTKILPSPRLNFLKQLLKLYPDASGVSSNEAPAARVAVVNDTPGPNPPEVPSLHSTASKWLSCLIAFYQTSLCGGSGPVAKVQGGDEEVEGVAVGITVDLTMATYFGLLMVLLVVVCGSSPISEE
eukprot:s3536_g1.t2